MKTTDQKNQVIASKVGICCHDVQKVDMPIGGFEFRCLKCHKRLINISYNPYPDFFTPEGQVVLVDALRVNKDVLLAFIKFIEDTYLYPKNELQIDPNIFWLSMMGTTAKETKLAELFFQFIQEEKK